MIYAQTPSTSYIIPTISQLQSYYGRADRIYVVEKNQDYVLCQSCTVNDSTVFSGAGGRKWTHISDSSKVDASANNTYSGLNVFNNKVGINNNNPLAPLHIGNANVNNSSDAEVLVSRNVDNTGTGNAHGYADGSQITRSGTMAYASYDGRINFLGTNSFDHYAAFQAAPTYSSTGTITNLYGIFSLPTITAGTVTNNYGSFIGAALITGGSIVNNYGLFIQSPTGGTSKNYSIYTNGPTPSRFQGGLISDSDIIANKNVIAAGTFKGNGTIQSPNIVAGIASSISYTPVKQLEARSNSGEAAIRISQSGQNNWDFKSPAGKTSLVVGDVTRDYFTILNQGWFGFNTLAPTTKFEVNSQVKIDSILSGNAGIDSFVVTQGGIIKKVSSANYTNLKKISDSLATRNYTNDSTAFVDGHLNQWDLYRTGNSVKILTTLPYDTTMFGFIVDNRAGNSANMKLRLTTYAASLSATVYWGDGDSTVMTGDSAIYHPIHTYASSGYYIGKIRLPVITDLRELYLNDDATNTVKITGINGLNKLTNLNVLYATRSSLTDTVVSSIKYPASLVTLSFSDNKLTTYNPTYIPSGLTTLILQSNEIPSSTAIYLPPTLTNLNIRTQAVGGNTWVSSDVNTMLQYIDSKPFNAGAKTLDIRQFKSEQPTGAGLTAKTNLTSEGWTVTTD
jgi:hypothetical protein